MTKDEIVKTLYFNSETGMPQYDPLARKVYVNLQDENIFAVIDPAMDEVIGRYPVGRHSSSQMTMLRWQEISRCWSRKYSRPSRHCGLTGWMSSQSTTNMINSRPVIIFVHYWGRGPADKMATGFKAALDELGKENK